jgi:hypothetical protein
LRMTFISESRTSVASSPASSSSSDSLEELVLESGVSPPSSLCHLRFREFLPNLSSTMFEVSPSEAVFSSVIHHSRRRSSSRFLLCVNLLAKSSLTLNVGLSAICTLLSSLSELSESSSFAIVRYSAGVGSLQRSILIFVEAAIALHKVWRTF